MANTTAYGFVGLEHLFSQRVTEAGETMIWDKVRESAALHSQVIADVMAAFAQTTTDRTRRVMLPGSGELQPLDEHGNPIPTRPAGYYSVGFPIQGGGDAWGDNRVTRALMTVEEANRFTVEAMKKDSKWIRRHALAAILDDTTWTFPDPAGDIIIQPLANGDTVVYNKVGGSAATDDHYSAQSAAIADATNPYGVLYAELAEHPGNSGPFVAYIPNNLVATTEALTAFQEITDPNIRLGTGNNALTASVDVGPGDELIGYVNGTFIVEWKALPDNYIIATARGTDPILGMRQYPAAALQGFFPEFNDVDGNHQENRLLRYAGFGAQNRTGAAVMFVSAGDTTYDIPTGFTAPLAV